MTLAGQTQDALSLAHSLADERDEVTSYIAAGRPKSQAPAEDRSARVDRQVDELRADTDIPAALRSDLDDVAAVRRAALTGKSSALEAHDAYSGAITELHRLAEQLAEKMPPRAGSGAYALAELDAAVQQAAATRGLLLAALNVPSTTETVISPITGLPVTESTSTKAQTKERDALSAAAQQARLRSDAALADFRETATKDAVAGYDSTVTGTEVNSAEKYLTSLTAQPTLPDDQLDTSTKKLDAALSARVDLMRGEESALYVDRAKDLAQLRDDDVKALELRIAILGALMLLAVGIATAMARTLTRPLSVLRRGSTRLAEAEDPGAEEPIKFTGRNDEFAQVVRSVNALHAHAAALHERIATLEADRKHLVGQRQKMADAREELRAEVTGSAEQLERLRTSIGGTFVNLALRTLGLVERQLAVIEGLEEREQDPDRLSTLFKLDHFATVMRRHSENLLVLAGTEHVQQHAGPVPLVDVVRAAVSEIERYERVRISALPPHAHVAGYAADDISHLLAELMENATSFSPPDAPVEIAGWLLENGEVMLSVQDEGIGMTATRMTSLNARLTEFDPDSPTTRRARRASASACTWWPAWPTATASASSSATRSRAASRRWWSSPARSSPRPPRQPSLRHPARHRRHPLLLPPRRHSGVQLQRPARPFGPRGPAGRAGGAGGTGDPGGTFGGRAEGGSGGDPGGVSRGDDDGTPAAPGDGGPESRRRRVRPTGATRTRPRKPHGRCGWEQVHG